MPYGQAAIIINRVTGKELLLEPSTIIRSIVDVSAMGDNEVIAAISGKQLRVISLILKSEGDVDIRIQTGTEPLSGKMRLSQSSGFVLSPPFFLGNHWVETGLSEAFVLNLSSAVQVRGEVVYYGIESELEEVVFDGETVVFDGEEVIA